MTLKAQEERDVHFWFAPDDSTGIFCIVVVPALTLYTEKVKTNTERIGVSRVYIGSKIAG